MLSVWFDTAWQFPIENRRAAQWQQIKRFLCAYFDFVSRVFLKRWISFDTFRFTKTNHTNHNTHILSLCLVQICAHPFRCSSNQSNSYCALNFLVSWQIVPNFREKVYLNKVLTVVLIIENSIRAKKITKNHSEKWLSHIPWAAQITCQTKRWSPIKTAILSIQTAWKVCQVLWAKFVAFFFTFIRYFQFAL